MARDFYDVLGVSRNAPDKDIRQAFRKLARKYHPDVNPGDTQAEERFKEINRAYEVLSDPEKRKKYDRYGDRWEQAEAFEKARQAGGDQAGWQTFSFDLGDLGDLFGRGGHGGGTPFEDIFGSFMGRRPYGGPMRGQNVEYVTEVTLEEAYNGATRVIQMQSEEACPTCGGSGRIANAVCHVCQGAGAVVRPKRIEVKIPPGVRDGSRVRIAGEGRAGMGGGPRGDLYVVTRVRPHPRFERRGDDLVTEVAVPLEDAVLGGEVEVTTLAGKKVALKIPPLTQNGRLFRLSGLGMPKLGEKGKGEKGKPGRPPGPRPRRPAGAPLGPRACAVRAAPRGAPEVEDEGGCELMVQRNRNHEDDEPLFVISVAAKMVGMHAQSLRHYERLGLIRPSRSRGRVRLYSLSDIERLRHIQRLVNDLGVNLAGAEVVIRLNERIRRMEEEMERLRAELQAYRDRVLPAVMEEGEGR